MELLFGFHVKFDFGFSPPISLDLSVGFFVPSYNMYNILLYVLAVIHSQYILAGQDNDDNFYVFFCSFIWLLE